MIYQVVIEARLYHEAGPIHPRQGVSLSTSRVRTQHVACALIAANSKSEAERLATAAYQTELPDPPIGRWLLQGTAEPISRKRIKAILHEDRGLNQIE